MASRTIAIVPAGGSAETDSRANHRLAAHEVYATTTFVSLVRLGAKFAAGQTIGGVISLVCRRPRVGQHDALRTRVEPLAKVVVRQTFRQTHAGARSFSADQRGVDAQAFEPRATIVRGFTLSAQAARVRSSRRKLLPAWILAYACRVGSSIRFAHLVAATTTRDAGDGLAGDTRGSLSGRAAGKARKQPGQERSLRNHTQDLAHDAQRFEGTHPD